MFRVCIVIVGVVMAGVLGAVVDERVGEVVDEVADERVGEVVDEVAGEVVGRERGNLASPFYCPDYCVKPVVVYPDLEEVTELLRNLTVEVHEVQQQLPPKNTSEEHKCESGWTLVAGQCMRLILAQRLNWYESREFCKSLSADLVTFKDANDFAAIISYVEETIRGLAYGVNAWVGGSDEGHEADWTWVTGGAVPMGAPFWGSYNGEPQPNNAQNKENCALMYWADRHYLHDIYCDASNIGSVTVPLCAKSSSAVKPCCEPCAKL